MNVISTLKKIFNSYDFRGNRIKNLRVDTPTEDIEYYEIGPKNPNPDEGYFGPKDISGSFGIGGVQHYVANKRYVDQKTTLNTERTWKFHIPFKFPWMKNIIGKPYKQVLDELLFPRLPYEYISPEVTDVKIFAKERPLIDTLEIDNNFKKWVVYQNVNNKFLIKISQKRNDWMSGITGTLIIRYTNGTTRTFNSLSTDNSESVFECEFLWLNIESITFKRIFDTYENYKTDTWGEPSLPPEPTLTLEKDITEYFTKTCYPFILMVNQNNSGWLYKDSIFLEAQNPQKILIKTNVKLDKQYCLEAYIYNEQRQFLNKVLMGVTDFFRNTDYQEYDFGYFPHNVIVQIVPKAIRLI